MKLHPPPTAEELRKLAEEEHDGARFHEYQHRHSRLSPDEKATERALWRAGKLTALALERWACAIEKRESDRILRETHEMHVRGYTPEQSRS